MSKQLANNTLVLSLFIQIIIIIFTSIGLFIQVDEKNYIIKQIFVLEYIVQIIEATMYIWLSFSLINSSSMVQRRYIDWFITTPMMLLTTIMYMKYNTTKTKSPLTLTKIIIDEKKNILNIFSYNALMLFFGLLAEFYPSNSKLLVVIGFYFFYKLFYTIYDRFVLNNIINTRLFIFITTIWGLYGIAALMNVHIKNICYNILDIISKNFYELYIFWIMLSF